MKILDIFRSAWGSLGQRKFRTALTCLGIAIGIAAIVALLSLSQGFQSTMISQIEQGYGLDTLTVSSGRFLQGGEASSSTLYVNDTQQINGIEGVVLSSSILTGQANLSYGENSLMATVAGVNYTEYLDIQSELFVAAEGVIPQKPDNNTVVLGYRVANPQGYDFTTLASVGNDINISVLTGQVPNFVWTNYTFTVSAVLEESGGFGPMSLDNRVFIPMETAEKIFDTYEASTILVRIEDPSLADDVKERIETLYENQVTVISPSAFIQQAQSIFSFIDLFLGGIAGISLLVAGVGIMNIMIVSVVERTREIGILKALGAKNRTILGMFLSEAVLVGVLGGLIGIAFGAGLSQIMAELINRGIGFPSFGEREGVRGHSPGAGFLNINPVFTPALVLASLAFAIAIGTLFGLYPAWRAAKKEPVNALRYE